MYVIVNSKGERMYQYPTTTHRDTALKLLAAAKEQYPQAGMKLEYREEELHG